MKLCILCKYHRNGASSRLRTLQYVPYLKRAGFQVETYPLFTASYLEDLYSINRRRLRHFIQAYLQRMVRLVSMRNFSLIWVEKELFPYLPSAFEQIIRLANVPYVLDYDDAVFHSYDKSSNVVIRFLLRSKLHGLIKFSSLVIAGNPYLASYALDSGASNVIIVPTVVDTSKYLYRGSAVCSPVHSLRIGWIGTPQTVKYLETLLPVFESLSGYSITLVIVGARLSRSLSIDIECNDWSESTEALLISSFDIGIMPLLDMPWEQGKCGYKLIQYMACGKPVIASPVGINKLIVTPNVGLLASSVEEWIHCIVHLYSNPGLRGAMGVNARSAAEACYSLSSWSNLVSTELFKLAKSKSNS